MIMSLLRRPTKRPRLRPQGETKLEPSRPQGEAFNDALDAFISQHQPSGETKAPPLVCVISDDNWLHTRESSIYGLRTVRGPISTEGRNMFDIMFNRASDLKKKYLLFMFLSAARSIALSKRLGDAANVVAEELRGKKEQLNHVHIDKFIESFNIPEYMKIQIHNIDIAWARRQYVAAKNAPQHVEPIPTIPLLEDGSVRIAGCAGTKRMCDTLEKLLGQLQENIPWPTKIIIGRHGLSTKQFFNSFGTDQTPDFGHNVKIHGEQGYELQYFMLRDKIRAFCESNGIEFHSLTSNSFFMPPSGYGIPGTRLSSLTIDNDEQVFYVRFGNNDGPLPRNEEQYMPVTVDPNTKKILKTLCYTRGATFMHDLKLCWILSNYEKYGIYFKPQECDLWSGHDGDMLFCHVSEEEQKSRSDEYVAIVHKLGNRTNIRVTDNFLTTYEDTWAVEEIFFEALRAGIQNLKISAMVTDPGPSHISKAMKKYFPLGPQDGDDLLAINAIVGEGVRVE